jgi:hypothetical protein
MSRLAYNVGLTEDELNLLIRLIDDDEVLTDAQEEELRGIRRKLANKRKMLRKREREAAGS